jgi:hypothetical protein
MGRWRFEGRQLGVYIDNFNRWMNNATANNPSYEFYPPKNINGESIVLKFQIILTRTTRFQRPQDSQPIPGLDAERQPVPDCYGTPRRQSLRRSKPKGTVVSSDRHSYPRLYDRKAMIFNWKTNTETPLPGIPNGVRIS